MAESHPIELRVRVVRAYESGSGTYPQIAAQFEVGEASVRRWVRLHRRAGDVSPTPKGGGTPSIITLADLEAALAVVRDATAGELTAEFNRRHSRRERVHVSSIKRALGRHGYVVKKSADGRWRVCGPTSSSNARRT
jgi:transposase-like protein